MDERTAGAAARIRGRGALAATVLCDVLALGCAALAVTAPDEARPLLWAAVAVAAVGGMGCVVVLGANRRLEVDPRDRRPLARLGLLAGAVVLAWLLAVLMVLATTRDVAWTIAALGLVTLVLPALVLALVTAKGPHPA